MRALLLLLYDALLISLAVEDFKYRKIRNQYVAGILLLTIFSAFVMREISILSRVIGMFAVSVPMAGIALFKSGSFGGGDLKLTAACGLFLGYRLLLNGTIAAIFLAGIYCVYLICIKKKNKNVQFALGPFLSAGYILSAFALF